jgi:hypothetical protein
MLEAFLSPGAEQRLQVKTCQMLHAPSMSLPSTRKVNDMGTTWTIKPARLYPLEADRLARR